MTATNFCRNPVVNKKKTVCFRLVSTPSGEAMASRTFQTFKVTDVWKMAGI